jgi:hypothetical protein
VIDESERDAAIRELSRCVKHPWRMACLECNGETKPKPYAQCPKCGLSPTTREECKREWLIDGCYHCAPYPKDTDEAFKKRLRTLAKWENRDSALSSAEKAERQRIFAQWDVIEASNKDKAAAERARIALQPSCEHVELTPTQVGGFTCNRCGLFLFHAEIEARGDEDEEAASELLRHDSRAQTSARG